MGRMYAYTKANFEHGLDRLDKDLFATTRQPIGMTRVLR